MLYLVRHGQTEFNAEGRVQGALDSALTPLGVEQGRRLGVLLAGLVAPDCRIVCSPQGRACHTAQLIRESGGFTSEAVTDARLAEVSLGDWDGLLRADIEQTQPDHDGGKLRWTWFFHAPKGDRYETLQARLGAWLEEARGWAGPTIVVSHGVAGRILRGLYLGLSQDETMRQDVPQDAVYRLDDNRIERIAC